MGKKAAYEKILRRKKVLVVDAPGQPPKTLGYYQALALAQSHHKAGRRKIGNYCLEQIAEQVTTVPEPSIYLLHLYLDEMILDAAERLVIALQERFPTDSLVLRACARFYQVAGELAKAEALMQHAVSNHPNNANNVEMLAILYQSMGDTERALEYFDRTLRIDPNRCGTMFGKARLLGGDVSADFIAQVRSAVDSNKFSGVQQAFLQFAMALIYADRDVDLHFAHLHEANRIVASTRKFDVAAETEKAEKILYRFRQPNIDGLQGLMSDDFKPIFVVGMPRSGTTLLEQIIGAHPQCHPIGESNAFSTAKEAADALGCPPMDGGSPQMRERCREYFIRISENFKKNSLVASAGDKAPVTKTIGNHKSLGLILLALPNARVIHLERHPLAVIYSCYQQNFAVGNDFSFNLEWAAEYYKIYKMLMDHWHAVFPGKILTVRYEDLVRDKKSEVERVLKFCDLDISDACIQHEKSIGAIVTSSDIQVRRPVYQSSMEKWKKVEPHLEPVKRLLGEMARYHH